MVVAVQPMRLLTTIFFSDVAGFSAMMMGNESKTLQHLRVHNVILTEAIAHFDGKVVKTIGDAFMAHFPVASNAVRSAILAQHAMARMRAQVHEFQMSLRIGIHLGEVQEVNGDYFGHSVNVASRTESQAQPDRVAITEDTYYQVKSRLPYTFHPLGTRVGKNVGGINLYEIDPSIELQEPTVQKIASHSYSIYLENSGTLPLRSNDTKVSPLPGPEASYVTADHILISFGSIPYFYERKELFAKALKVIKEKDVKLFSLQGLAGSGKTVFMCHVARLISSDFPLSFALRFGGRSALEPGYILSELNTFLRALGKDISHQTLAERSPMALLPEMLKRLIGHRVLVLLDAVDQAPPDLLEELCSGLSSLPHCKVLMTSRDRIGPNTSVITIDVPPLSQPEAHAFIEGFVNSFGLDLSPPALLEGLPVSLWSHPELLARVLHQLQDVPFEMLRINLDSEALQMNTRIAGVAIKSLDPLQQELICLLSVFSGSEIMSAVSLLPLKAPQRMLANVQVLLSRSIIYRRGSTYLVPPVVRHCLEHAIPESFIKTIATVIDHLCSRFTNLTALPGPEFQRFGDLTSIVAVNLLEMKQWKTLSALYSEPLLERLNHEVLWKEYMLLLRCSLAAGKMGGDHTLATKSGCRMLRKLWQTGDISGAKQILSDIESLQIGNPRDFNATIERAEIHSHRALLLKTEGKPTEALSELAESAKIRESLQDRAGLGVVEKLIGVIHLGQSKYPEAEKAFEKAKCLLSDDSHHFWEAEILRNVPFIPQPSTLVSSVLIPQSSQTPLRLTFVDFVSFCSKKSFGLALPAQAKRSPSAANEMITIQKLSLGSNRQQAKRRGRSATINKWGPRGRA